MPRASVPAVFGFASALVVVSASVALSQNTGTPPHGLSVDDLLRIENVVDWDIAPGRGDVALVVQRSKSSPRRLGNIPDFAGGLLGADLVILPADGSAPRNITRGSADSSGAFFPTWSPDGRNLAFVSNRGGGNTWAFVYDRITGRTRRLSSVGIDVAQGSIDAGDGSRRPLHWMSDSTILATFLPEGVAPWSEEPPQAAVAAWKAYQAGKVPTASALESPTVADPFRLKASLRLLNVAQGTTRIVVSYPYFNYGETRLAPARLVSIAPGGKRIALLVRTGTVAMSAQRKLGRANVRTRTLGIAWLDRPGAGVWLSGAFRQLGEWSSDGSHLSVLMATNDTLNAGDALGSVLVGDQVVNQIPIALDNFTPDMFVRPLSSAGGRTLVYGHENTTSAPRNDWWSVGRRGERVNATASLPRAPTSLFHVTGGALIGAAGGSLWRIDPDRNTATVLSLPSGLSVTGVVTPGYGPLTAPQSSLVITARADRVSRYYRVLLGDSTPAVTEIPRPTATADLVTYNPTNATTVFYESGPLGTNVWVNRGRDVATRPSLALNGFLAGVQDSRRMLVSYRGLDSSALTGLLLLPPDYNPARRYPMVVSVYGGDFVDDTTDHAKNDASELNLNLLPSHGFAVFVPSMPLAPYGAIMADPMHELLNGVMPGVAKVVEMGIADSSRVGVMGFSYGGYSVYSLITQTTRFKAAVAISGSADLVSLYGEFGANQYGSAAHQFLFSAVGLEGGWGHIGGTPWTNLASYMRNSPFYLLDRVETPLLILHGDLDEAVPISQSEQVFSALFRLGKRARFIRYWGETHGFSSPANIRDLWNEMYRWFDTNLK